MDKHIDNSFSRKGADIVGLNCSFDLNSTVKTLRLMKQRLDEEGLDPFLMAQPLGFHCPERENDKDGYLNHASCPLCKPVLCRF